MTELAPIWSPHLVKKTIWSTHLVTQQYPSIRLSNLVNDNLVISDQTGSDNGQSGQSNLVNQTNMVKPIWSSGPIWSIHLTLLVNQLDLMGYETLPIWSII
jgi:hypothetical protein